MKYIHIGPVDQNIQQSIDNFNKKLDHMSLSQAQSDGIDPTRPYFRRDNLLLDLIEKLQDSKFVLLSSPSASGKTSLLRMFMEQMKSVCCITYISCVANVTLENLLWRAGIQTGSVQGYIHPVEGVRHVVILDDAQTKYGETGTWGVLVKAVSMYFENQKCSVIISAVHALKSGTLSPVSFRNMPQIKKEAFLLSKKESLEFISDTTLGLHEKLQSFVQLKEMIATDCGGIIGALSICVRFLNNIFRQYSCPTEEQSIRAYFSMELTDDMERCFGPNHSQSITQDFVDFLRNVFVNKELKRIDMTEQDEVVYYDLLKAGILVESKNIVDFSSEMARRYYFKQLFPNRSLLNPSSLVDLIRNCVSRFSSSFLQKTVIAGQFPKEATFQHILFNSLAECTECSTFIYPELSRSFDGEKIPGEIDFFVDGELFWGIELLVNGGKIGEHIARFGPNGKYAKLDCKEYCIVDFRQSNESNFPNIKRYPNRITVVFIGGKYTSCWFAAGEQKEELLKLAN